MNTRKKWALLVSGVALVSALVLLSGRGGPTRLAKLKSEFVQPSTRPTAVTPVNTVFDSRSVARRYAAKVAATQWGWSAERAAIAYSLGRVPSPYEIVALKHTDHVYSHRFKVTDGAREVYAWPGHSASVFSLRDHKLYYTNYSPAGYGGEVVAVDLRAGKSLWKAPLRAVPVGPHSAYSNSLNIESDGEVVSVFGNEVAGRYYEIKDAKTGETVGHKVFDSASKLKPLSGYGPEPLLHDAAKEDD